MLVSTKELLGYQTQARDGEIGKVADLYFDDRSWRVRYLVLDTRRWLPGRKVLIAPEKTGMPQWEQHALPLDLTRQQVQDSPGIEEDMPVSKQKELELARYYQWTPWWTPMPGALNWQANSSHDEEQQGQEGQELDQADPHLRSFKELRGYHLETTDDGIGHVEDLIVETVDWNIRYLVVDTRRLLPGKKVLLAPGWIDAVKWRTEKVEVALTAEQIKQSPPFDPGVPINRVYETRLYDYYGRPHYWAE